MRGHTEYPGGGKSEKRKDFQTTTLALCKKYSQNGNFVRRWCLWAEDHQNRWRLSEKRERATERKRTGIPIKEKEETKKNVVAHKEFLRVTKLLNKIEKCDALYENIINRYCLLYAECRDFEEKRERFYRDLWEMEEGKENGDFEDSPRTYYKLKNDIQKNIVNLDKQVQAKRKMMMAIEKESIMTLAAAMRSVPKTPENETNTLLAILEGGKS